MENDTVTEILNKLEKGVALFDQQKYWECHEELEHWWLEDSHQRMRYIYWGIIQVAAALIHYREGNLTGARGLIKKAKEKIKVCQEESLVAPEINQFIDWQGFVTLVEKTQDTASLEDYKPLFNFRFRKNG